MGSLSHLYKSFLRSLLTYASPAWFPFLSVSNVIKLERLHRVISRAIIRYLSSYPIPLLPSKVFLSTLRVTLTHIAQPSYQRAHRFPTFFPILDLARLGVKPRLCRPSWRAFASTHPFMIPSASLREVLFAFLFSLPWNLPSFTVEFTLSSRSDSYLSHQVAALAHVDSLPPHDLVLWTNDSVPFRFEKGGSGVLANCFLCGHSFLFSANPVCSSFSAEACAILQALCCINKSAIFLLFHSDSRHLVLFCIFLLLQPFWQELTTPSS